MPKPKLDDSVSLFPFLDIMASLIGILVLLITAATLAQIGQTVEDAADAEAVKKAQSRIVQYRAIRKRLAAETREQERLRELVEQAEAARQQLEQLRAEVARLEAQQKIAQEQTEKLPALEAELKRLQEQIEQAEPELEKLQKQLAELRSLLANRQESGQSEIQILPSGSGYDLEPTFVECAANAVVLHDRAEPLRILVGQLASHPEFAKLLDTVKQQPKGTIVFLVRPDGASTYQTARNLARRQYVTNGKLAVAGHGKIDLSMFRGPPP